MCGICCVCSLSPAAAGSDKGYSVSNMEYVESHSFILSRGPDSKRSMACKLWGGLEAMFAGFVLHLRGELTPQPLTNDDGDILLWNGEIFGGVQVKEEENDTQVLFQLLNRCESQQDVVTAIQSIQGPWALVYWQAKAKRLWFGRDVFGRRSLLWHLPSDDHIFALSSVPITPWDFAEVPSVGLFCLEEEEMIPHNNSPAEDLIPSGTDNSATTQPQPQPPSLSLHLYPWVRATWPGTSERVVDIGDAGGDGASAVAQSAAHKLSLQEEGVGDDGDSTTTTSVTVSLAQKRNLQLAKGSDRVSHITDSVLQKLNLLEGAGDRDGTSSTEESLAQKLNVQEGTGGSGRTSTLAQKLNLPPDCPLLVCLHADQVLSSWMPVVNHHIPDLSSLLDISGYCGGAGKNGIDGGGDVSGGAKSGGDEHCGNGKNGGGVDSGEGGSGGSGVCGRGGGDSGVDKHSAGGGGGGGRRGNSGKSAGRGSGKDGSSAGSGNSSSSVSSSGDLAGIIMDVEREEVMAEVVQHLHNVLLAAVRKRVTNLPPPPLPLLPLHPPPPHPSPSCVSSAHPHPPSRQSSSCDKSPETQCQKVSSSSCDGNPDTNPLHASVTHACSPQVRHPHPEGHLSSSLQSSGCDSHHEASLNVASHCCTGSSDGPHLVPDCCASKYSSVHCSAHSSDCDVSTNSASSNGLSSNSASLNCASSPNGLSSNTASVNSASSNCASSDSTLSYSLSAKGGLGCCCPSKPARVAVLFSGGVDSSVLAALADKCVPEDEAIDLINVAFEQKASAPQSKKNKGIKLDAAALSSHYDVPDRQTGLLALSELNPQRCWNFVEVNVTQEMLQKERKERVSGLVYPLRTVLDDSIGCAVWFAARGVGRLANGPCQGLPYTSPAKVILCGMGADEQLAGYSRHRARFQQESWSGLIAEITMEIHRISARNLGRDDRVIADHSRESRFPFLDEDVVDYIASIPIHHKADLRLPRGLGEKFPLRLLARRLGLRATAVLPKRAIQFGSRIAKLEQSKEKGSQLCQRLVQDGAS